MEQKQQQQGGFRITDRDLELVRWLGRVRLATVDEVRVRFGLARSKAYGRLRVLVDAGLVVHERRVPGHGVFVATREGLRLAEVDLAPATVSLGALRHDLAVAGVVAELERDRPGLEVLTERELRAHAQRTGDETFRPRVQHRRGSGGRHWPDLVLPSGAAWWAAVEVELTAKSAERTRAILRAYGIGRYLNAERALWGVLYLVPGAEQERRIRRLARDVGLHEQSHPVALCVRSLDGEETVAQTLARFSDAYVATAKRVRQERQRREAEAARRRAQEEARAAAYRQEQEELAAAQRAAAAAAEQQEARGFGRLFAPRGRGR